jgi:hypothetical protein
VALVDGYAGQKKGASDNLGKFSPAMRCRLTVEVAMIRLILKRLMRGM